MDFPFKKAVSAVCIAGQFSLMFWNISAYASSWRDQPSCGDAASCKLAGHNFGYDRVAASQNDMNHTDVSGGTINFGNSKVQKAMQDTGGPLKKSDLSAATSGKVPSSRYYTTGKAPSITDMQSLQSASDDELTERSQANLDNMDADLAAEQNGTKSAASIEAQAYSTVRGAASRSRSISASDPVFSSLKETESSLTANPFYDCEIDKRLISKKKKIHTPVYKSCSDAAVNGCTLTHHMNPSVAAYMNGAAKWGQCSGSSCVSMHLGKYYGRGEAFDLNSCNQGYLTETIKITNPGAITWAGISSVRYRGSVIVTLPKSSKKVSQMVLFAGADGTTPSVSSSGDIAGLSCSASSTQRNGHSAVDLTSMFKSGKNGGTITFQISYKGAEPDVELQIGYDPSKVVLNDELNEPCATYARAIESGDLKGTVTCTASIANCSGGYCSMNGVTIPQEQIQHIPTQPYTCTTATVKVDPSALAGSGKESSDSSSSGSSELYSCSDLKAQGCGLSSSRCALFDKNQQCVIEKATYDCGYAGDHEEEVTTTASSYKCPGAISCMGVDCVDIMVGDATKDFNKALALMQESQQGLNDVDCTASGTSAGSIDPSKSLAEQGASVSCTFFKPTKEECKDYTHGAGRLLSANNCCKEPGSQVDTAQYIRQIAHVWKMKGVGESIQRGDFVKFDMGFDIDNDFSQLYGVGWDLFKNYTGVGQAYARIESKILSPITNALNNIIPYAGDVFKGLTYYAEDQIIAGVMNEIVLPSITNLVYKVGQAIMGTAGSAGGGSLIGDSTSMGQWLQQKLAEQIGKEAAAMVAEVISIIGWVYAIYSAAKMLSQIWSKCTNDEIALQSKIREKNCGYAGRWKEKLKLKHFIKNLIIPVHNVYCCFQSPLSRILNKQVKYALKGCNNIYPDDDETCAFGPAKSPDCTGITMEQMEAVDWTKIDLTEWLTLLSTSGSLDDTTTGVQASASDWLPIGGYDDKGNRHGITQQVSPYR